MMGHLETDMADAVRTAPATVASVRDLKVHFAAKRGVVHAVDGVSFDIRDGETLGLVGETGCGKSVTGRSFLRLLPVPPGILAGGSVTFRPHALCEDCDGAGCDACGCTGRKAVVCPSCRGQGCATCDGTGAETIDLLKIDTETLRKLRGDRVAMIFQDPGKALNPTLTIGQQVAEVFLQHRTDELIELAGLSPETGGALRRFARQDHRFGDGILLSLPPFRGQRRRIQAALDKMVARALAETQVPNPASLMDRYPHELSGGMRQRVMIAQALACNPDLLIADEPTTALDVTVEARILELIRDLQMRRRSSVLYISHDLSLVRRICDRVAVMYAGRVVEIGPTAEVFRNPRHPYTRGLLAAVPTADTPRGGLAAIKGTVPELVDPPAACRFAGRCRHETEACRRFDPTLEPVSETHAVACFIDHPAPEGDQPSFERITE
ncbi:MAG: oligopeptide transport system ATP-binding protein [Rhodobacteraceae bacterium HLUCCA08]|nr:MAG: oligopeptide transport system ATP-binding protein [Rhodobacteraceae bacterium HLUCCA08]